MLAVIREDDHATSASARRIEIETGGGRVFLTTYTPAGRQSNCFSFDRAEFIAAIGDTLGLTDPLEALI